MRLGVDGQVAPAILRGDDCCPPDLCSISKTALACIMVGLLPRGPIWDRQKQQVIEAVQSGAIDKCEPIDWGECVPFASHSIYTAHRLYIALVDALLPALYESSPETAYHTIDDWLDRLGWIDCFENPCCADDCANTIKEFNAILPNKTDMAVKRAIAIALSRVQMGGIRNLDNLNWVTEPLRARLSPTPLECAVEDYDALPCPIEFDLTPVGDTLECPQPPSCGTRQPEFVSAFVECPSGTVWPAMMAAECIVRSLMPRQITINRNY